jgi:hypothetical protein
MTIKYRAGKVHTNVDPLSRAPSPTYNTVSTIQLDEGYCTKVAGGYHIDPHFHAIEESLQSGSPLPQYDRFTWNPSDGLIHYQQPGDGHLRLCLTKVSWSGEKLRLQALADFHHCAIASHVGTTKTMNAIAKGFYWPGIFKDVKDYVRSCHKCQLNKASNKNYGSTSTISYTAIKMAYSHYGLSRTVHRQRRGIMGHGTTRGGQIHEEGTFDP